MTPEEINDIVEGFSPFFRDHDRRIAALEARDAAKTKPRVTLRGRWDAGASYAENDAVIAGADGALWRCRVPVPPGWGPPSREMAVCWERL